MDDLNLTKYRGRLPNVGHFSRRRIINLYPLASLASLPKFYPSLYIDLIFRLTTRYCALYTSLPEQNSIRSFNVYLGVLIMEKLLKMCLPCF